MAFDKEARKLVIADETSKLTLFKNLISQSTAKENQLSSILVRLQNQENSFSFGDILLIEVSEDNTDESDKRNYANLTTLENDTFYSNIFSDSAYLNNQYLYTVPFSYESNFPYYRDVNGAIYTAIPPNTKRATYLSNFKRGKVEVTTVSTDEDTTESVLITPTTTGATFETIEERETILNVEEICLYTISTLVNKTSTTSSQTFTEQKTNETTISYVETIITTTVTDVTTKKVITTITTDPITEEEVAVDSEPTFNTITTTTIETKEIVTTSKILKNTLSTIFKDGLDLVMKDLIYFTQERDSEGELTTVSNEVHLSVKALINYIEKYIENLELELNKMLHAIPPTEQEQNIADIFELKEAFAEENTRYAGMVGELWVGFGLYVETPPDLLGVTKDIQVADTDKLDEIYKNWRDIVNIETINVTETIQSGDDSSEEIEHQYQIYRLDHEKTMRLPPRILIPILHSFITMRTVEIDRCEWDGMITFIIAAVIMYFTGVNIYALYGAYAAFAFYALSILAMSGVGGKDFQLVVKILLVALTLYTSYTSLAKDGLTNMEVFSFSVQLTSSSFDIFSTMDLERREDILLDKEAQIAELEEELDLSSEQDKITEYIFETQYDDMYDAIYDTDSAFYTQW